MGEEIDYVKGKVGKQEIDYVKGKIDYVKGKDLEKEFLVEGLAAKKLYYTYYVHECIFIFW